MDLNDYDPSNAAPGTNQNFRSFRCCMILMFDDDYKVSERAELCGELTALESDLDLKEDMALSAEDNFA